MIIRMMTSLLRESFPLYESEAGYLPIRLHVNPEIMSRKLDRSL
jgi:hypothetical protein